MKEAVCRSCLILLGGAPASGKSTLSGLLGQRPGWFALGKDEFKEVLFDTLGAVDAAASRRLSDASFALQFLMAQRLAGVIPILLLEGNFRAGEHEAALGPLLPAFAGGVGQILCEADLATRRQRLAARRDQAQRHPAHADAPAAAAAHPGAFLDLPGPRWQVDGTDRAATAATRLGAQIEGWFAGTGQGP